MSKWLGLSLDTGFLDEASARYREARCHCLYVFFFQDIINILLRLVRRSISTQIPYPYLSPDLSPWPYTNIQSVKRVERAWAMDYVKLLFVSPEINPSNRKALSIPVLNPFNKYGRVFTFSWLGFMVAFLSWYAFPPLVRLYVWNRR